MGRPKKETPEVKNQIESQEGKSENSPDSSEDVFVRTPDFTFSDVQGLDYPPMKANLFMESVDLIQPDYLSSFKVLLEALELQQIDKLLEENNPETFKQIGTYITKAAKLGAPLLKDY